MLGMLLGHPEIKIKLQCVWEMIVWTPSAIQLEYRVSNYEPKISEKWYEAFRVCVACQESYRAAWRFEYSSRVSGRWLTVNPLEAFSDTLVSLSLTLYCCWVHRPMLLVDVQSIISQTPFGCIQLSGWPSSISSMLHTPYKPHITSQISWVYSYLLYILVEYTVPFF